MVAVVINVNSDAFSDFMEYSIFIFWSCFEPEHIYWI